MLKGIIAHAAKAIEDYFRPEETNLAARAIKWIQRTSKLDGDVFLKTMVFGLIKHPQASLNQLCQTSHDLGVEITAQGLDERINAEAVVFLRERVCHALEGLRAQRQRVAEVLEAFSEVYFLDSTVITLPDTLRAVFAGVGGAASTAAVKIQLLFAYLRGNLAHLDWLDGRSADQSYTGHLAALLPGSLVIQDLGFFQLRTFQQIAERNAFFLTRWRADICVFLQHAPQTAVDLLAFLQHQTPLVDSYAVLLGREYRLPARMICVHLPPAVAAERRRKLKEDYRRRGATLNDRLLALCDWNIFLTNLPPERLSLHQLLVCYTLRWQVELIFKLWKSQAALDHLAGLRKERILCELYAKMIGLVLTHFLVAPLRFLLLEQGVEISPPKARQVLEDRAPALIPLLRADPPDLQVFLLDLAQRTLRFARKTHRLAIPSSLDRLNSADLLDVAHLYPATASA
jgi:hypothetical protein